MRTTLNLDHDVLDKAREIAESTQQPFRYIVNEALREGLQVFEKPAEGVAYKTNPQPMGLKPGLNIDNIQDLISLVEGEDAL